MRHLACLILLFVHAAAAHAQGPPVVLAPGNAAVAGFSGARSIDGRASVGAQAFDKTFIDLSGPSLRVIDLGRMGGPPQGQLVAAPKPFTATAEQIGQVFSIALDDADPPNIYAAATSAYGLPIVVPDRDGDGRPDRARRGGPNAAFMPGLFGSPAADGGPGSIWKIHGRTGVVTLFANVVLAGVPNSGPALGGLGFDPASRQLFAADRDTGMIHRFTLDGVERGQFDHGVIGLSATGFAPVPFDPRKRLNLESPAFDSAAPATWAFAPPARRVFGITVRGGRLYYAVAAGLRVWSVAILPDGSVGSDARIEVQLPSGPVPNAEISDITFDDEGRMLLAERGAPTGAYDFQVLAQPGSSRTLRLRPKPPGAGGTPFFWEDDGEYAIGFPPNFQNANGGVAIGYGYDSAGTLTPAICGGTVWATGERLRMPGDSGIAQQLAPGGPFPVDGLQGHALPLLRPQNTPPFNSYFIDYDDLTDRAGLAGHLGDVAIWRICPRAALPVPLVVTVVCPVGWLNIDGVCQFPRACPPGTDFGDGCCFYRGCPPSYVRIGGRCVPPPRNCGEGETYSEGRCQAPLCPPGLVVAKKKTPLSPLQPIVGGGGLGGNCPDGQQMVNDQCPPPRNGGGNVCVSPTYCECPDGTKPNKDGTCEKTDSCGPNMVSSHNECVCEAGYQWITGSPNRCVPLSQCNPSQGLTAGCCPAGSHWNQNTRQCEPGSAGPQLRITKRLERCCTLPNDGSASCSFSISVTNIGTAPYAGPIDWRDFDSTSGTGGGGSGPGPPGGIAPGQTVVTGGVSHRYTPGARFMNCVSLGTRPPVNSGPPGPDLFCLSGDVPAASPACQAEAPRPGGTPPTITLPVCPDGRPRNSDGLCPTPPVTSCPFPTFLVNGICCTREAITAGTCGFSPPNITLPLCPDGRPRNSDGNCPTPVADLCPDGKPKRDGVCPNTCWDGNTPYTCPQPTAVRKKQKPKPKPRPSRPETPATVAAPPVQFGIGIGIGGGGRGGRPPGTGRPPGGGGGDGGRPPSIGRAR